MLPIGLLMLSQIRIFVLLLLTASCGFQPVHGTASALPANSPITMGITIVASANTNNDNKTNSMARQFSYNLEDILPSTKNPAYRLEVALNESVTGLGVARDGTASRYNLNLNSTYSLIRISDNKQVDNGTIGNVTSYNNPSNQYFSTFVSEQDARKRGVKELAELYRQRLISFTKDKQPIEIIPDNSTAIIQRMITPSSVVNNQ